MSLYQENASDPVPELQQNIEILKEVPFFEGFPPKTLKLLAYLAVRGDYEEGDVIFERGDDPGIAFAIVSGELAVYLGREHDEKQLWRYGEGAFLGSFALVGPMVSLFTVKATMRTRLLLITREQFTKILDQYTELGPLLRKAILRELQRWEQANIDELDSDNLHKVGVTLL
ncbi:MAG: Crp/Fnr family transcriptional regulator [Desulfopila sp.]